MRRITRGVVVVCVLVGAVSLYAAPGDRETVVRKIVKKIRSLGDGLTIPGSNPTPNPTPKP